MKRLALWLLPIRSVRGAGALRPRGRHSFPTTEHLK